MNNKESVSTPNAYSHRTESANSIPIPSIFPPIQTPTISNVPNPNLHTHQPFPPNQAHPNSHPLSRTAKSKTQKQNRQIQKDPTRPTSRIQNQRRSHSPHCQEQQHSETSTASSKTTPTRPHPHQPATPPLGASSRRAAPIHRSPPWEIDMKDKTQIQINNKIRVVGIQKSRDRNR